MNKFYDRDSFGAEFDDRLIIKVKGYPAIYDVNHPNYRKNPVRVAIWERIAAELGAPSKFIQTKWKNIRYNYLQEIKVIETGTPNPNIRKRRFTEDLSFLLTTAQSYNVKKSMKFAFPDMDNDSSNFLYGEPDASEPTVENEKCELDTSHKYDVIEIENSDDEDVSSMEIKDPNFNYEEDIEQNSADNENSLLIPLKESPKKRETSPEPTPKAQHEPLSAFSNHQPISSPFSPLLTPLEMNGSTHNGEVTIEAIPSKRKIQIQPAAEIIANATKRKAMNAPIPVLTPINDPIELYCLSMVDSLRNMPRTERERVKYEFAKILKDAKYKNES